MTKKAKRFPFCSILRPFPSLKTSSTLAFILLSFFIFLIPNSFAAQLRIAWDPNTEPDLAGYEVFFGTAPRSYGTPINVGNVTTYTFTELTSGQTYYFAVRAYDSSNNESGFSNEVSGTATELSQNYSFTVGTNIPGVQFVVDGNTYSSSQTFTWTAGSAHTLSVTSPQPGLSGTRYVFSTWSDGGAQSHNITAPSANSAYMANFATQYSLTTSVSPVGAGTASPSGTGWYGSGQSVSVTATANSGYNFAGWTGDLSGTSTPASVTMNGPKTVNANFAVPGTLLVTSASGLTSSGNQGGPFSPASQTYTIQNTGGTSINWSVSKGQSWITLSATSGSLAAGVSATVAVSINTNANSLSAGSYSDMVLFNNTTGGKGNTSRAVSLVVGSIAYTYTFSTNPPGLQMTVDGANLTTPRTFSWTAGSSHTLSIPSPQAGASGTRHVFNTWSDGGALSHTITVPPANTTYMANFVTQYSLTTGASPIGAGKVSPSGTNWYNSGQGVSITASANSGYNFGGWTGDISGGTSPASVLMNRPKSVSALFNNPNAVDKRKWLIDFDNDGKTDIAFWRPADATWHIMPSSGGDPTATAWGGSGDIPVPGDYDGDGKTDIAVYRAADGTWHVIPSLGEGAYVTHWGASNFVPIPADYDGDGKTDIAVYRPEDGSWHIIPSSGAHPYIVRWGASNFEPVPGDYDGDGKTDIAVYRPKDSSWHIIPSSGKSPEMTKWKEGQFHDLPLFF